MKSLLVAAALVPIVSFSQTITNGNFNSTSTGWGCSPETTHFENVYGGTSTTNRVAEVDAAAGLCQTVTGFTIGSQYSFTFDCSRRTTCGPTLQSMSVTGSGGIISATVSRNGGGFGFTGETFVFIATSTSHTFTMSGTSTGTCGLIIDNVAINLISPLPVELLSFDAEPANGMVNLSWATASEINNNYFTVLRSKDGEKWNDLTYVAGAGNSSSTINYATVDKNPFTNISYYQLKQTDFDGEVSYSDVRLVNLRSGSENETVPFPNPTRGVINLKVDPEAEIEIFNALGQNITSRLKPNRDKENVEVDLTDLDKGVYYVLTGQKTFKVVLE